MGIFLENDENKANTDTSPRTIERPAPRISIAGSIVIASIVLGLALLLTQALKQESIEKQQQVDYYIDEQRRTEDTTAIDQKNFMFDNCLVKAKSIETAQLKTADEFRATCDSYQYLQTKSQCMEEAVKMLELATQTRRQNEQQCATLYK